MAVAGQAPEGSLLLAISPTGTCARLLVEPATVAVVIWRVDVNVVRLSLRNVRTGTIAYVQGTDELVSFAGELGLRLEYRSP